MQNRGLIPLLVLSGFTGLAYEFLWVRLLALSFGSTTLSFSTVLAVFFGGLAVGAWVGGRFAHRLERPGRAYAILELGIGLSGALLYPVLANLGAFFAQFDPGPTLVGAAIRGLVALPLLSVPTLLMGATLPIVVRAVVVDDREAGRATAIIYGINTLGAFLGAFGVAYAFLHWFGVAGSNYVTVLVNVVVAGLAWVLGRAPVAIDPVVGARAERSPPAKGLQKAALIAIVAAFATGFSAIALQVVWVRMFSILLGGTIYGVSSVLIAVLAGLGLGSLVLSPALTSAARASAWFVALQAVIIVSVILPFEGIDVIAYVLASVERTMGPGYDMLLTQLGVVFVVLLVPALASGASLPALVAAVERGAEDAPDWLGRVYAANTVGSISGSIVAGFVLLPISGSPATVQVAITATALGGLLAIVFLTRFPRWGRLLAALGLVLSMATYRGFEVANYAFPRTANVGFSKSRDALERRLKNLAYLAEGRGATVAVTDEDATGLILNGLGQGSMATLPPHWALESLLNALVPLAHIEDPRRALVVGLGAGVTVDALLALDSELQIDVVELEADVVDAVDVIFREFDNPLESERVQLHINDARHHLLVNRAKGGERLDVITSMPAHPWVAASIFTREFFQIARDNLTERGVFCTWFGLTRIDISAVESLLRAFDDVFDHGYVYLVPETGAFYLVGSPSPLTWDAARYARLVGIEELRGTKISRQHEWLRARLLAETGPERPLVGPGPVNTDDSALVEIRAPLAPALDFEALELPPLRAVASSLERDALTSLVDFQLGDRGDDILPPKAQVLPLHAERWLEASSEALEPAVVAYFEGRIALARRQRDEAQAALKRAATPPWRERAERFLIEAHPPLSDASLEAWRTAPPGPGVIAWGIDQGLLAVTSTTIRATLADRSDEASRLLRAAADPDLSQYEAVELVLGLDSLEDLRSAALAKACRIVAERGGLSGIAAVCEAKHGAADRALGRALQAEARAFGGRGAFAEAERMLRRGLELNPEPKSARLWITALVELGAWSPTPAHLTFLEGAGMSREDVSFWAARAEARRNRSIEDPETWATDESGQSGADDRQDPSRADD